MYPQRAVKNLIDLSKLKDGWYDGDGIAPSGNDIQWLIVEAIEHFSNRYKLPVYFPMVCGGIIMEWCNSEYDLTCEVYRETKKAYIHCLNITNNTENEIDVDLSTSDGWETLKSFIKKVNKMNNEIDLIFKAWCKETKRSGGVLTGQSLKEWHEYLGGKMEEREKEEAINFYITLPGNMNSLTLNQLWERYKNFQVREQQK